MFAAVVDDDDDEKGPRVGGRSVPTPPLGVPAWLRGVTPSRYPGGVVPKEVPPDVRGVVVPSKNPGGVVPRGVLPRDGVPGPPRKAPGDDDDAAPLLLL